MAIPLAVEHLNHVARPTKRLEQCRRFWMDVMGAREISRPGFSFGGSWLYLAGIQIHLIEDAAAPVTFTFFLQTAQCVFRDGGCPAHIEDFLRRPGSERVGRDGEM